MLLLTSTSHVLRVTRSVSVSLDIHASWVDNNAGTVTPGVTTATLSPGIAAVDIVAAPASGVQRNVQTLTVRNLSALSSVVTVFHVGVGLFQGTLLGGWTIQYVDGDGWSVFNEQGQRLGVGATGATGPPGASQRQANAQMQLRTHPDADKAASQVILVHADQVILQDGTEVTSGLDGLVANITVSGAGGLSSYDAIERASQWYQVHLIRKSSDGTLNLLLHRDKDYFLDQSQTAITLSGGLASSTSAVNIAQSITPATSGIVPFVDLPIAMVGAPDTSKVVWFTLETDNAGVPSGTVLATSQVISVANLRAGTGFWRRIIFRARPSVTASTKYWIVAHSNLTVINGTDYIAWGCTTGNPYAGGQMALMNNSNVWDGSATYITYDLAFKWYVERFTSSVSGYLPSGYDQYAFLGGVRNDGSSNFREFMQLGRHVRSLATRAQNAVLENVNVGTEPVLSDLSAFIPPMALFVESTVYVPTGTSVLVGGVPYGWRNNLANYADKGADQLTLPSNTTQVTTQIPTEFQGMYGASGNFMYWWVNGYQW